MFGESAPGISVKIYRSFCNAFEVKPFFNKYVKQLFHKSAIQLVKIKLTG